MRAGAGQERDGQHGGEGPGDEAMRGVAEIALIDVDVVPAMPQPAGDVAAQRRGDQRDANQPEAGGPAERRG